MLFNYFRFGNPFNYEYASVVTGHDLHYATFRYSLQQVSAALYHYVLELPHVTKNFPFYKLNQFEYADYGKYYYTNTGFGLCGLPYLVLGLFLMVMFVVKQNFSNKMCSNQYETPLVYKVQIGLLIPCLLVVYVFGFTTPNAITAQYLADTSLTLGFLTLAVVSISVTYENTMKGIVFFVIILCLMAKSIIPSLFLPLNIDGLLPGMNPDLFITLMRLFAPFSI